MSSLVVPPALAAALREHQVAALHFLWRRLVDDGLLQMAARTVSSTLEQRALLYQEVFGCIVGHSMGLGKTLTTLSFLLLLQAQLLLMALRKQQLDSQHGERGRDAAKQPAFCPCVRTLVVCPKSCIAQWVTAFDEWVRPELFGRVSSPLYAPAARRYGNAGVTHEAVLRRFHETGGLLILGYEEYVRLSDALGQQRPSSPRTSNAAAAAVGKDGYALNRVLSMLDHVRKPLPLRATVSCLDILEGVDVVVLDEAHRLKRGTSRLVQSFRQHLRQVQLRVALTGTPLQNHLEEYNVMQSLVTGSDLDKLQFSKYFIRPIELGQCVDSSFQQFSEMQRCVASLRQYFAQTVHHCGPEELERVLPPRREFVFFFELSARQAELYRALISRFQQRIADAETGASALQLHHAASHISLHPALASSMQDVQTVATRVPATASAKDADGLDDNTDESTDDEAAAQPPTAFGDAAAIDLRESPKLRFAVLLVEYIVSHLDEKVVVFSRYVSHLYFVKAILETRATPASGPFLLFSGAATEAQREAIVAELQTSARCKVLLCSVGAGGVGLNMNAANHCILLDVSWNPSDDTQATYRVYRYGQRRPVTVYRLATRGTTEQVVFSYALQKSWLHRKIADVTDPTRHERHVTKSYFAYPCNVPLDDGTEQTAADASLDAKRETHRRKSQRRRAERESDEAAEDAGPAGEATQREVARRRHFYDLCVRECPPAGAVLARSATLRDSLYAVVRHNFLLRAEDTEAVKEMEGRFRRAQRTQQALAPIVLAPDTGALVAAPRVGASRPDLSGTSLLSVCEEALVDVARVAANHLIWHVVQLRHDAEEMDASADSTAVVREVDRSLCKLLQPLLRKGSAQPPVASAVSARTISGSAAHAQGSSPALLFTSLAEAFLFLFQEGVLHVVRTVLSQSSYLKVRTLLTSRIPRPRAAQAHGKRPRGSTLTHGVLEDALLYRPHELLANVDATELTFILTEMGFVRAFVPQCVFIGLQQCLLRLRAETLPRGQSSSPSSPSHAGDGARAPCPAVEAARALVHDYFNLAGSSHRDSSASSDDDSQGDSSCASWQSPRRTPLGSLDILLPQLTTALEDCLGGLWPSGSGLTLPAVPLRLDEEQQRTARALSVADRQEENGGLFSLAETASLLHLERYLGRHQLYTCPRCGKSALSRSADTVLGCVQCHYNAEFAIQSDPRCQHSAVLYQLSFACNLLDAFSISKSFSTSFTPAKCRTTWEALMQLRGAKPVYRFIDKCMTEGVEVLLAEFPTAQVELMSLQCGAGEDRELMRALLLANAHFVWSERLRRHVRGGLTSCFRDFVGSSSLGVLSSMPLMSVILCLFHAARHEEVGYAAELLEGEHASNVPSAHWTGGRRRELLRFACDGLVKLLYAEKLLEHCKAPPAFNADTNEAQEADNKSTSNTSDVAPASLHLSSDSSSSASGRLGSPTRRRPANSAFAKLLRTASSSSSSSTSSSPSSPPRPLHSSREGKERHPLPSAALRKHGCSRRRPRSRGSSSSLSRSSWSSASSCLSSRGGRDKSLASSSSSSFEPQLSGDSDSSTTRVDAERAPSDGVALKRGGAESAPARGGVEGEPVAEADIGSHASLDEWLQEPTMTVEQLEDEATLQQRSAQYWVAFCEVYGTNSAASLTVFVEDEELGLTMLPPPPPLFWVSHLTRACKEGQTVSAAIERFMEKLLAMSRKTRLVK